jgi:hypothetical protein
MSRSRLYSASRRWAGPTEVCIKSQQTEDGYKTRVKRSDRRIEIHMPWDTIYTISPSIATIEYRKHAELSPYHYLCRTRFELRSIINKIVKISNLLMATIDKSSSSWSSDCAMGIDFLERISITESVPSPLYKSCRGQQTMRLSLTLNSLLTLLRRLAFCHPTTRNP